ncbi:MAG: hypothetical protein ACK55Z_31740, partial [bacterium]
LWASRLGQALAETRQWRERDSKVNARVHSLSLVTIERTIEAKKTDYRGKRDQITLKSQCPSAITVSSPYTEYFSEFVPARRGAGGVGVLGSGKKYQRSVP